MTYGAAQVSRAAEYGAVEHLLLTQPPSPKLAALVERSGGHWETFAAGTPEHQLLTQFTGMCAVLRFAVDDTEPLSHKFVAAPMSTVLEPTNTASVLCDEEPDEPAASADLAVMLMQATEAAAAFTDDHFHSPLDDELAEEFMAMSAIFEPFSSIASTMFEHIEGSRVCIAVHSDQEHARGVCFGFTVPNSYPSSPCEVRLIHAHGLSENDVTTILHDLRACSELAVGTPALYTMVLELQDSVDRLAPSVAAAG